MISLFGSLNLAILIVAAGFARSKLRQSSLCSARIGEHSVIPIRYQELHELKQVIENLSLAELEAAISTSHDNAYQISLQTDDARCHNLHTCSFYTSDCRTTHGVQTHADLQIGAPRIPTVADHARLCWEIPGDLNWGEQKVGFSLVFQPFLENPMKLFRRLLECTPK